MKIRFDFDKKHFIFENPKEVVTAHRNHELSSVFHHLEEWTKAGDYAAGFLSYEAGLQLENKLKDDRQFDFPLMCFGRFSTPKKTKPLPPYSGAPLTVKNVQHNISRKNYFQDIQAIHDFIEEGEVYQITYCFKLRFDYEGDSFALYHKLLSDQWMPYTAHFQMKEFDLISLSPELFIKKEGSRILSKPMKGTWPINGNFINDLTGGVQLKFDKKNRAENVMIADLLRNDLGRIAKNIRAPKLFDVARYKTLFQMTSTITGDLDPHTPFEDIFRGIFPSGSVTGAPKIRAMQVIKELEQEERKIYTGAIGYITPERSMYFNIPIRTILKEGNKAELGIGGGIVWDSTAQGEWDEGHWKARFLTDLEEK